MVPPSPVSKTRAFLWYASRMEAPDPTPQDIANAETRRAIAEKQEAEYAHCLRLALGALGPGWTPWMKLVLIDSGYHLRQGTPAVPVATVYKVHHGELRLTENSRYLIED